MGMGSAPVSATCISKENLTELCPDQVQQLEAKLDRLGVTLGQLGELLDEASAQHEDHESFGLTKKGFVELFNMWQAVADEFNDVTNVSGQGLDICLCSYDPDRGDRYDEIDGNYFFSVDGVYHLTPAGQRFRDKLEDKAWTVYG